MIHSYHDKEWIVYMGLYIMKSITVLKFWASAGALLARIDFNLDESPLSWWYTQPTQLGFNLSDNISLSSEVNIIVSSTPPHKCLGTWYPGVNDWCSSELSDRLIQYCKTNSCRCQCDPSAKAQDAFQQHNTSIWEHARWQMYPIPTCSVPPSSSPVSTAKELIVG